MKTVLPWLLFVMATASAGLFYKANQAKTTELTQLQVQIQEQEALKTEVAELKKSQMPPEELARLNEAKNELMRLRGQVQQLNKDKAQLNQQALAAKAQVEQVQAQAQAQVQAQNQVLAKVQEQAQTSALNACINHLGMFDAAKQQWALENNKAAAATPTVQELAVFLPNNTIPTCPAGGKYTLGNLVTIPTCSIAGHSLPPPPQ